IFTGGDYFSIITIFQKKYPENIRSVSTEETSRGYKRFKIISPFMVCTWHTVDWILCKRIYQPSSFYCRGYFRDFFYIYSKKQQSGGYEIRYYRSTMGYRLFFNWYVCCCIRTEKCWSYRCVSTCD